MLRFLSSGNCNAICALKEGFDMSSVKRIKCVSVNCYIVSEGDFAVLVDTGKKKYLKTVMDACEPYKIKLILLTHGHDDHAENAAALSVKLGVPVGMHKADENLLASVRNQPLSAGGFSGKMILSAALKEPAERKRSTLAPSVFFEDGDDLTEYGVSAKVIGLPGHTKGSIGIDVGGKDLIVGDALMNIFYPTVSMLYHDEKAMLDSARKITALGERTVYFGHGRPTRNRVWVK